MLPASTRKVSIYLHPEDAELVRNTLQLDQHEEEQTWKLYEDATITRGGCQIKADKSVINATLERRLQALAASVFKPRPVAGSARRPPRGSWACPR